MGHGNNITANPDKLNFGCGTRFSGNWVNIDFHSTDKRVKRVNLLSGFPFPDASFGAVYSSHVLEHFERNQGRFLLEESFRVLRKGGILRIVVPNLQGSCEEYLRILSLPDGPEKKRLYSWAIIELLDQMVRNKPAGQMGEYITNIIENGDEELKNYVRSRTENTEWNLPSKRPLAENLKRITPQKLVTKIMYGYLKAVSLLIPPSMRSMVFVKTYIGERHRWMYDHYSMRTLLEEIGFSDVRSFTYNESNIPDFNSDHLDCNPDGEPYKHNSIYIEGTK